jgi:hypothetical protein
MEVRVAYAAGDFEWDITEKLVGTAMESANTEITLTHFLASMKGAMNGDVIDEL